MNTYRNLEVRGALLGNQLNGVLSKLPSGLKGRVVMRAQSFGQ